MIEIAPDNHLAELKLVPIDEHDMVEAFEEFNELIECGMFGPDECGTWACQHEGRFYYGGAIEIADRKVVNAPGWATHVYWWGA